MNKYALKKILPHELRWIFRRTYYAFTDLKQFLSGTREDLIPPKGLIFIGDGDYKLEGENLFQSLMNFCALKPHHHVLDVGCGIGRVARPLTQFLNAAGSYDGFDIVPQAIKWCQRNISAKYPNFRFQLANIYNKKYFPKGKIKPSSFSFPYQNNTFDVVFLTSVFTHMLANDVEQYLREISRVLKPGGKCLISYFLINAASNQAMENNQATIIFKNNFGVYSTMNIHELEAAVAYDESFILKLYQNNNLILIEPIQYGFWSGLAAKNNYQDFLIAQKA